LVYDEYMPKKTLALIAGLVLVTVILAIIAYRTGQQQTKYPQQEAPKQQEAADVAHTTLALTPNPVTVGAGQQGTVEVTIDTSDNPVTAIQLELLYDPTMITNLKATPGPMFANPGLLFPKNDPKTGRMTLMVGIQPGQKNKPVSGQGVAVVLTFTARGTAGQQSQISVLPNSLATARGVAKSVLKEATGTTVMIGSGTGATGQTQGAATQETTTQTAPVVTTAPTQ
jgi:hypothetical protein